MKRNRVLAAFRFWRLCVLTSLLGITQAAGQQDSTRIHLKVGHVVAPAALTLASFSVQGKISRQLNTHITSQYPNFHTQIDDYMWAAPSALTFGLSAAGVRGKHKLGEQILLFLLSNAVSGGATQIIKWVARYPRPNGDEYDAFPSGHTNFAFTGAVILHEEYGHRSAWYPIGGYTAATAVGGMRLLNNRHWLADVLMGAAMGIGATKGVYLVYPWAKQKVRKIQKRGISPVTVTRKILISIRS